mgnify:CR=1 FL=1
MDEKLLSEGSILEKAALLPFSDNWEYEVDYLTSPRLLEKNAESKASFEDMRKLIRKTKWTSDHLNLGNGNDIASVAVKVAFDIPEKLSEKFNYAPGQYINILAEIGGKEERRSYSICSAKDEKLAIGIKSVKNGIVSNWFNLEAQEGTKLFISEPQGNFKIPSGAKHVANIAAGSGITPILSILKSKSNVEGMHLLYGNRSKEETMFLEEIKQINNIKTSFFFDTNHDENAISGRIEKDNLVKFKKNDLTFFAAIHVITLEFVCAEKVRQTIV